MSLISNDQVERIVASVERLSAAFERIAEAFEASAVTQSNIAQESIRTMQATQDMLGKDKGLF